MNKQHLASLFLRFGLAFVFFYAAISALVLPNAWIGYYPQWMRGIISDQLLLYFHSFAELALAFWLLSGKKIFYAAILSSLWLLGIILGTLTSFLITFRDVAILASTLALAVLSRK